MNAPILAPPMSTETADVPCNGCRRCCIADAVRLLEGDDWRSYETEPHERLPGHLMLAHKRNGECVYLGEHGCTIHARRPIQCRTMDCRDLAVSLSYTEARKLGRVFETWRRGRELLREAGE